MARTRRSIKVFVLEFFIDLALWISIPILFLSILPRYTWWFVGPRPLDETVLTGIIGFLLWLVYKFLLKKRNR